MAQTWESVEHEFTAISIKQMKQGLITAFAFFETKKQQHKTIGKE